MKLEIKELFDEMIDYKENHIFPKSHLKKAYREMEVTEFALSLSWLLLWLKQTKMTISNIEKYHFDHPNDYIKYKSLFKNCNLLKDVFVLDNEDITWNTNRTNDEILEIRDYVHENHKIEIRIRYRNK